MSEDRRAVIIGAGVIGSSIALEMARAGWQTTVLDKLSAPGEGSTSASSAIVRYHYNHLPEAALAWEAAQRWRHWERHLGTTDPRGLARFIQSGALVLDGELMEREPCVDNMRTLGIPFEELTSDEIRSRFPALDVSALGPPARLNDESFWREASTATLEGYWVPDAGHVDDPQLAALNLAYAAGANGAQFRFKTTMTGLQLVNDRVVGVTLDDGSTLPAEVVVNAAGPWSHQVNAAAGALDDFLVSTRPLEQEVISLPVPAGFRLDFGGTCANDPDLGTYFRPHGDTILVGGMEADCDPLVYLPTPEDARTAVSQETWEVQSLRIARRIPALLVPNRPSGVVGVYDVSDDWIPIYDRTAIAGFYVAIGTSGHGFKQAPMVGELIQTLVEACESGHDHDRDPVAVTGRYTGKTIDLGHFSRRRAVVPQGRMN